MWRLVYHVKQMKLVFTSLCVKMVVRHLLRSCSTAMSSLCWRSSCSSLRWLTLRFTTTSSMLPSLSSSWRRVAFTRKGKGKRLDTCYSATYMRQTRDQQRFTISEVAADCMSQWCRSTLCGHPLPALMDSWTHSAASRHTIAPISHTRPSPNSYSYYSFPVPLRVGGWVGLSTQ